VIILEAYGTWRGWHMWPEGAERGHPELAQPHWHNFQVRVRIITTEDREVEFIALGKDCADVLRTQLAKNRGWSCESMATYLLDLLESEGEVLVLSVSVSEDGKSRAIAVSERRLVNAVALL